MHECLTHVHASDETGCLPPRRVHHEPHGAFPLSCLVLSLRLQPEPSVSACLRPRALGRSLSASPALRTWGLSALSPAASLCVSLAGGPEAHPVLLWSPSSARTRPCPKPAAWRFLGLASNGTPRRPHALLLCVRQPRGGKRKWALINHRLRVVPYLCFRKDEAAIELSVQCPSVADVDKRVNGGSLYG